MSNKTKLPPMKHLRPPTRSSIERRHCSDPERFTFALVRATAQMERAKQLERKKKRRPKDWDSAISQCHE